MAVGMEGLKAQLRSITVDDEVLIKAKSEKKQERQKPTKNPLIVQPEKALFGLPDVERETVIGGHRVQKPVSMFYNPRNRIAGMNNRNVIPSGRTINFRVLRHVAEKAFLINTIINHQMSRLRPFIKPTTTENHRGFQIRLKDRSHKATNHEKDQADELMQWFQNCGYAYDPDRDDLPMFIAKQVRELLTVDQVCTELTYSGSGDVWSFFAVDPATILRVNELGYEGDDRIRFIQEVDMQVVAKYTHDNMIFDYANPRVDIDRSGYGYSFVEQAVDLIVAQINAFSYNVGAFTEDRLPRGMLLLNGDAGLEETQMLEDYIVDLMSGGPMSKWRVPIIPSGGDGNKEKRTLEWVSFQNSNREMEFVQWTEFLWTAVAALFGVDLEEIGVRTSKSTALIGENVAPRIQESKSRGLGSILSFLEDHAQKILNKADGRFDFEFVGYEREDPATVENLKEQRLKTTASLNDLLREEDKKPLKEKWADIPGIGHQFIFQLVNNQLQNEMMQQQAGGGGFMGGGAMEGDSDAIQQYRDLQFGQESGDDDFEDDDFDIDDEAGLFESMTDVDDGDADFDFEDEEDEASLFDRMTKSGRSVREQSDRLVKSRKGVITLRLTA